jgi:spore coat protein CotH
LRYILIFSLLLTVRSFAQTEIPDYGILYTQAEIPIIYISIDPDSLNTLYLEENWYENHEYTATFVFQSSTETDTLENIGLRFRGNTSRDKIKKSFKVSLNTYVSGQKYQGVEKINLNAEVNDPSMLRSRLCWDLYREYNIPASRSNHVNLYINGEYYGLYQNIEHVDDEFVETYFGNDTGNLYKCTYPANLDYISNNPDDYKLAPWGTRTYELKTNEQLDDYSDLAEFIGFLNLSSNADLECELNEYFNVSSYLKVAAIDVLVGNWDGYIYNQNNFYLYHNPLTGQFEYIPYDVDNTWGIDWLDRNWSDRNIYNWSQTGQPRPLFNRLMDIESFRQIFSWHVQNILNEKFSDSNYQAYIQNLQNFIEEDALNDPYRPLDFGYSADDFLNALDEPWGGHVDFSILGFIDIRNQSAQDQLEFSNIPPIITDVKLNFEHFPDSLNFAVLTEGPAPDNVVIEYSLNGGPQESTSLNLTGGQYELALPLPVDFSDLQYNVRAVTQGNTRWAYCTNKEILFDQSGLVLNEVMSSNTSSISDNFNEYDDWVEVYNQGDQDLDLENYFLSDNNSSQIKWKLPATTINSGQFELYWADKSIEQGSHHTNFRLSASGERLYLFKKENNTLTICDFLTIPSLPTDFSFGRNVDGSGDWILFDVPTPDASNQGVLSTIDEHFHDAAPYPNPTKGLLFFDEISTYRIFDLSGRLILEGRDRKVNLNRFKPGVYSVLLPQGHYKVVLL